jgi:hypothetical protein
MTHRIEPGQEYETCTPIYWLEAPNGTRGPVRTRIRVTGTPAPGWHKVEIVTVALNGRTCRPRRIEVGQLHPTGTTKTGATRRTGYRLVQHPDGTPATEGSSKR